MRAAALAALAVPAPGPASCLRTASDQDRVAQAFVSAALRLAPILDISHRYRPLRVWSLRIRQVRP